MMDIHLERPEQTACHLFLFLCFCLPSVYWYDCLFIKISFHLCIRLFVFSTSLNFFSALNSIFVLMIDHLKDQTDFLHLRATSSSKNFDNSCVWSPPVCAKNDNSLRQARHNFMLGNLSNNFFVNVLLLKGDAGSTGCFRNDILDDNRQWLIW